MSSLASLDQQNNTAFSISPILNYLTKMHGFTVMRIQWVATGVIYATNLAKVTYLPLSIDLFSL